MICAADARPPGRADYGQKWQTRICVDLGNAGAAHPAREGDFEYLHEPGVDSANGQHFHDDLRQSWPAGVGETEPGEDRLCRAAIRQTCESIVFRSASVQRVCGADRRGSLRNQLPASRTQNRRRTSAEEVLSRTRERGAVVLYRDDYT